MQITRKAAVGGAIGVGAAVLVALALRPAPIEVDTALAERATLVVTLDEEGRTRVRDRFTVTAPVTGRLERIELREGAPVEEGQVLARIAPLPLDPQALAQARARLVGAEALAGQARARVEQARVALDQAERALQRRLALADSDILTAEAREQAELTVRMRKDDLVAATRAAEAAAAEVEAARAPLRALEAAATSTVSVPAPATGRVLRVSDPSERIVTAGTPIIELGDASALEVVVPVLSVDAARVPVGAPVRIEDWGGEPIMGVVRVVEPSAFTRLSALGVEEQRVNVIVDLSETPPALGDGYRVQARILLHEAENALLVPVSAVFPWDGGWALFVVEAGRARLRTVRTGERNGTHIRVLEGVDEGAEVILFPPDRLADGDRVRPRG